MTADKRRPTIDQAFKEFLAEQRARLSERTYRRYEETVALYGDCLEGYWPGHDQEEYDRVTKAGGTFCGTFGPEEIPAGLSEFLGWFVPRKVAGSKETMKAAGTVTKKLVKWLVEKGYLEDDEHVRSAEARAADAARDLPASRDVVNVLEACLDWQVPETYSREIEDHFTISRVGSGKLWLQPLTSGDGEIGPVPVPREVSRQCRPGWDISGVVVKTRRGWRLADIWNVLP